MSRKIYKLKFTGIAGSLQARAHTDDGVTTIYLSGDRLGLKSLARILTKLANLDQTRLQSLPGSGASEHVHLEPNVDLARSSQPLIVGRLDDKEGKFDETFEPRSNAAIRVITHLW
jgi:hypothetical protein